MMKDLLTEIEKLEDRISLDSAPIHYSNLEASAWIDGYLTAVEEIAEILKRKLNNKTDSEKPSTSKPTFCSNLFGGLR